MTNLAIEDAAYSTYSLEDASKDAALLHKLNRKATLATAMIDQEIAALQQTQTDCNEIIEKQQKNQWELEKKLELLAQTMRERLEQEETK